MNDVLDPPRQYTLAEAAVELERIATRHARLPGAMTTTGWKDVTLPSLLRALRVDDSSSLKPWHSVLEGAIEKALFDHALTAMPVHMVVWLEDWNDRTPLLSIWPCSANPEAHWRRYPEESHHPAPVHKLQIRLRFMDVTASAEDPATVGRAKSAYPETSICSQFSVCARFFVDSPQAVQDTFETTWAKLGAQRSVNVVMGFDVTYTDALCSVRGMGWVTLVARFSTDACLQHGYRNLNAHLLALPAPPFPFQRETDVPDLESSDEA